MNGSICAGTKCIPWLGDLSQLGPLNEAVSPATFTTFPVKPGEKRSYAQACVVWVQPGGLQADIQKILRHARKMPDKTQHFYKVNTRTGLTYQQSVCNVSLAGTESIETGSSQHGLCGSDGDHVRHPGAGVQPLAAQFTPGLRFAVDSCSRAAKAVAGYPP